MSPRPTFLNRVTWGLPHYVWLALLAVLVVAMIPRAARRAAESNNNRAADWLPQSYPESTDLRWYQQHFGGEAFIVASWEGCTLTGDDRLPLLADKLRREPATLVGIDHPDARMFRSVVTGPELVDELTRAPANLSRDEALERLNSIVLGPASADSTSRQTCLVAYLQQNALADNRRMRVALDRLVEIATTECNIPAEDFHYGGPPADNVAIDVEAESTLRRLAWLSGLVGATLAYICFRSFRVTGLVLFMASTGAGLSLALVFYWGVAEVLILGNAAPHLGRLDAVMMSMPAVVYVLGLSGAIHLVNYYRDAIGHGGRPGAVERAVRMAWLPVCLAALTTALGLFSLGTSDILPIKKFGIFTGVGIIGTLVLLFTLLPVGLHCYPPKLDGSSTNKPKLLDRWIAHLANLVCRRSGLVATLCVAFVIFAAIGLTRLESRVQLLKLLDPNCRLVKDYAWLEQNLGNLVPMEVVVAIPRHQLRDVDDHPELTDEFYPMALDERLSLIRGVADRIEQLDPVSHTLSVATFAPEQREADWGSIQARRSYRYGVSQQLAEARGALSDYLQWESSSAGDSPQEARELWRISARIAALSDIDFGEFVQQLRDAVEPVVRTYAQRDAVYASLHERGGQLAGARIAIFYPAEEVGQPPDGDAPEVKLRDLLLEGGAGLTIEGRRGAVLLRDAKHLVAQAADYRTALAAFDAVVVVSDEARSAVAAAGIDTTLLIDVTDVAHPPTDGIDVTYTGIVPLVYKTQRELLVSLRESMMLAVVLITCVLVIPLRSLAAGLVSMLPNMFPIVVVFGMLGWLGISIDIGIMMTASVALGVAVDDTLHFVHWFGQGTANGLNRREATLLAYQRCGRAMVQTTIIAGLGLAVFAASTFTPTRQFGLLMVTMLGAALVGDLIMLPALLVGPLGRLFGRRGQSTTGDEQSCADAEAPVVSVVPPDRELPPDDEVATPSFGDAAQEPQEPEELPIRADVAAAENGELAPHNAALRARLRKLRNDAAGRE